MIVHANAILKKVRHRRSGPPSGLTAQKGAIPMKKFLQMLCQKLHISRENAGLWLQLILCVGAIFVICRRSLFSISTGTKKSGKKKASSH